MFYLMSFGLFWIVDLALANTNPYISDPYCFMRLLRQSNYRDFALSGSCDLEPLAKPYVNFPPSFFIIGVQKGGTTALTRILRLNTVLDTGYRKEISLLKGRPDYFKKKCPHTTCYDSYKSKMSSSSGPSIDASPGYSVFGGFFIENLMHATGVTIRNMPKMVFILRNPVTRIYSHYAMLIRWSISEMDRHYKGNMKVPSLEEYIKDDLDWLGKCGLDVKLDDPNLNPRIFYSDYLMRCLFDPKLKRSPWLLIKGMYGWQLEMLRRSANPNRILVACFDDFNANNYGFVNAVANFIGVNVTGSKAMLKRIAWETECPRLYREKHNLNVSLMLEKKLHSFYLKWTEVLREDFGISCGWRRSLNC